jgi:hypothetical protein
MVWCTVLTGISEMQWEGVEWIRLPQVTLVAGSCIFNCPSFNALGHNGKYNYQLSQHKTCNLFQVVSFLTCVQ